MITNIDRVYDNKPIS